MKKNKWLNGIVIILFLYQFSLIINLLLNYKYAIRELKHAENIRQVKGIFEIVQDDYMGLIYYLTIQCILILIIFIYRNSRVSNKTTQK